MKRVFRSIIDFRKKGEPTIPLKELQTNYKNFVRSKVGGGVPGDVQYKPYIELYHWIEDHYRVYREVPLIEYINDKAEREGNEEVLAVIRDIVRETPLIGSSYRAILDEKYQEQNISKLGKITQETWTIASSGMEVKVGKKKTKLKGINDAIQYFGSSSKDLRLNQVKIKTESDIRSKADSQEVVEAYRKRKRDPDSIMGMFTHIEKIDEVFKGIKIGDLFVVAAYVGQGKTTFVVNLAYNAMMQGLNGMFISMEMTFSEMRDMFYVLHTSNVEWYKSEKYKKLVGKVSYENVMYGELSAMEQEFFEFAAEDFHQRDGFGTTYLHQPTLTPTPSTLEMDVYDYASILEGKGKKLDFLVVDYVGLMVQDKDKRYGDFNTDLNNIIKSLKNLAMTFKEGKGLRIITPFQVNREGWKDAVKNDGVYKLTALSNANESERASDQIIALFMTDVMKKNGLMKLSCLKHRRGAVFSPFEATIDFPSRRIRSFISSGPSDDGMVIVNVNPNVKDLSADIDI